jgi:hypothetical protein
MMSKISRSLGLGVLLLLAGALGCDSGEAESVRVKECRNVCQKRDMCLRDTDLADCEQRCGQQEVRSDLYFQLKAQCVSDGNLSCDEWAGELDAQGEDVCLGEGCLLDECVHRELAKHTLSAEQEDYCQDLSNYLSACERTLNATALAATCESTLLEVSPEYAKETEECLDMACTDGSVFRQCFADLALRYETEIKIFGL